MKTKYFKQEVEAYISSPRIKDYYRDIYASLEKNEIDYVVDVGCASGDLLYFMPERIRGVGLDSSAELISCAIDSRKKMNIGFKVCDVEKEADYSLPECHTCAVIAGTLHTAVSWETMLSNVISWNPNMLIIQSPFNSAPVDCIHWHKRSEDDEYQCAYNILSLQTIIKYLENKGVRHIQTREYKMTSTLMKGRDCVRNHHVTIDGEVYIANGLGIHFKEYIIEAML